MKLYGSYTSPFVRHCRVVLFESALPCEFVETDAAGSARLSPTQRVPYFEDGEIKLSDSSAIVKYLREKSGQSFLHSVEEYNLFSLVNTVLDTTINLFFLEKDGLGPEQSKYLSRQKKRIEKGLQELDSLSLSFAKEKDDLLRLACFLDWGLFRERISLDDYPSLRSFLEDARSYDVFAETSPPVQ